MLPHLKEMLAEFGQVEYFWIDSVKSHCYFTYDSEPSAQAAYKALHQTQWPPSTGKNLQLMYIPTAKVEDLVKQEEQAKILNRGRMELSSRPPTDDNGEWIYELVPFGTTSQNGIEIRGLASAIPIQARLSASTGSSTYGGAAPRNAFGTVSAPPMPPRDFGYGSNRDRDTMRDRDRDRNDRFQPPRDNGYANRGGFNIRGRGSPADRNGPFRSPTSQFSRGPAPSGPRKSDPGLHYTKSQPSLAWKPYKEV